MAEMQMAGRVYYVRSVGASSTLADAVYQVLKSKPRITISSYEMLGSYKPQVVRSADWLVVVPNPDRWIGKGIHTAIADFLSNNSANSIIVAESIYLTDKGIGVTFRGYNGYRTMNPNLTDWTRVAELNAGSGLYHMTTDGDINDASCKLHLGSAEENLGYLQVNSNSQGKPRLLLLHKFT